MSNSNSVKATLLSGWGHEFELTVDAVGGLSIRQTVFDVTEPNEVIEAMGYMDFDFLDMELLLESPEMERLRGEAGGEAFAAFRHGKRAAAEAIARRAIGDCCACDIAGMVRALGEFLDALDGDALELREAIEEARELAQAGAV